MTPDWDEPFVAHYRESDGAEQLVHQHLEAASALASGFAAKAGIPTLGAVAGLVHDLGKYSAAFQAYLKAAVGKSGASPSDEEPAGGDGRLARVDHSSAGAQLAWQTLHSSQPDVRLLAGQMLALSIASHHSGLIDCLSPSGEDKFGQRMAKQLDPTCRPEEEERVRARAAELLASPAIENELAGRLAALRSCPKPLHHFVFGLMTRFLFSALIDADRLNTADFEHPVAARQRYHGDYRAWPLLVGEMETHLRGLRGDRDIDAIRRRVSLACLGFAGRDKGLYQLTVPTGGGKTLASLRFALHHAHAQQMDRIVYVAPYTSIIDQNADAVREVFKALGGDKQIVLEHHSNLTPQHDTWQTKLLSENWDAPIVFTTGVQLLESLFGGGTRGVRRMHQLANAVVIFDEAQAIPIKTIHLFNNALNFLVEVCGSTVVLCTATQPLLDRVDASKGAVRLSEEPEMMPDVAGLFQDLRRVDIVDARKTGGWTADEVAARAVKEIERQEEELLELRRQDQAAGRKSPESQPAGSALIIVNTKAQARELYEQCRGKTEHVYHLSTSMCPAHRLKVRGQVKGCLNPKDPKRGICVSTQLIEAGVDVDFGCVVRYLAGVDSIAQAAGRCNRNGRRSRGQVLIVNASGENLDSLPEIRLAQEVAERVLHEFEQDPAKFDQDLLSPAAISLYYHYYFFKRAHEMAYPVSRREVDRDDTLLSLLSANTLCVKAYQFPNKPGPAYRLRQSFKAAADALKAIEAPTEGVIVPYQDGERIICELLSSAGLRDKARLLKKAQRYSVSLFPSDMRKLQQIRAVYEVWEGSGVWHLDGRYYSQDFGVSFEPVSEMPDWTV